MDHGIIIPQSQTLVDHAVEFATKAHGRQVRKYTGEPYVNHTVSVARMVHKYGGDVNMVCAAILHDVIEDTEVTFAELTLQSNGFNFPIATLVLQLSDVSRPEHGNRKVRKQIDRQYLAGAEPRAQTIKYCDMLDNGESITLHDKDFSVVYMREMSLLIEVMDKGDPRLLERVKNMITNYYINHT